LCSSSLRDCVFKLRKLDRRLVRYRPWKVGRKSRPARGERRQKKDWEGGASKRKSVSIRQQNSPRGSYASYYVTVFGEKIQGKRGGTIRGGDLNFFFSPDSKGGKKLKEKGELERGSSIKIVYFATGN